MLPVADGECLVAANSRLNTAFTKSAEVAGIDLLHNYCQGPSTGARAIHRLGNTCLEARTTFLDSFLALNLLFLVIRGD